jgi:hypothetical protein
VLYSLFYKRKDRETGCSIIELQGAGMGTGRSHSTQFISIIINYIRTVSYCILFRVTTYVRRQHPDSNEHSSLYTALERYNLFSRPRTATLVGRQKVQTTSHSRIRLYPGCLDSHRSIEFSAPVKSLAQSYFGCRCRRVSEECRQRQYRHRLPGQINWTSVITSKVILLR